jgi:hypothetical protein
VVRHHPTLLFHILATTLFFKALHAGVVRDMERQERKRLNRIEQDQQLELRKQLEAEESKWKAKA